MGKPEESEPVRLIREAANDLDPPAPAETGGLKQKDNPESLPHFSEVDLRRVEGVGITGNPLYRLNKPLEWYGETFTQTWIGLPIVGLWVKLTVPVNFKTDLASVPGWTGFNPRHYKPAAIVHDYLCQKARNHLPVVWYGTPRVMPMKEADDCLYDALLDVGCPKLKAWTYWAYVRARHIALGEG
jgi:hypothetical protein